MRKIKTLICAVLAICTLLAFCSCGSGNDISVTVKINTDEYGVLDEGTVTMPAKDATVLKAIAEYCTQKEYGYTFNDTADSISSIGEFKETEKNKFTYFWNFTVDGKEVSGRASENPVVDGTVIEYTYTSLPIGDSASVTVKADGKEVLGKTLVVIESGDTVLDAAVSALKSKGISAKTDDANKTLLSVGEYQAKLTPTYEDTWEFKVNGKKISSDAGDTAVSKDDSVSIELVRTEKAVVQ